MTSAFAKHGRGARLVGDHDGDGDDEIALRIVDSAKILVFDGG